MSVDAHRQRDGESLSPMAGTAVDGSMARNAFPDTGAYVDHLLDRLHRSHQEERHRVARELHDRVAHAIAVVLQELELSAELRRRDPDLADRRQATAVAALRDTLDMLRSITQDLRVSAADDGITIALRAFLRSTGLDRRTRLRVLGDEEALPPPVRGELFLILREALRNIDRHAGARHVRVEVTITDCAVRAWVADDGHGFDPTEPPRPGAGIGLSVMAERAALLGGTVDVCSEPGNGTTVSVQVPLNLFQPGPANGPHAGRKPEVEKGSLMRAWDESDY